MGRPKLNKAIPKPAVIGPRLSRNMHAAADRVEKWPRHMDAAFRAGIMAKYPERVAKMHLLWLRWKFVWDERQAGATFVELAEALGTPKSNVEMMVKQFLRWQDEHGGSPGALWEEDQASLRGEDGEAEPLPVHARLG